MEHYVASSKISGQGVSAKCKLCNINDPNAKMNHSFYPNVTFLPNGEIITIRKIKKDAELLTDGGIDYWLH